jgi:hypothetical protein
VAVKEQPVPNPTPEQVLQQLQAKLQNAQQERGRLAATFAANQRAIHALVQVAEVRQQLAILQAEIQSMQQSQPPSNTPNQPHSSIQSQPNPSPTTATQPTFGIPYTLSSTHRTIDSKSPLSKGIQNSPWPSSYKPITLPKYNRKIDPRQFIMSFEAAIAFARGTILYWLSLLSSQPKAMC